VWRDAQAIGKCWYRKESRRKPDHRWQFLRQFCLHIGSRHFAVGQGVFALKVIPPPVHSTYSKGSVVGRYFRTARGDLAYPLHAQRQFPWSYARGCHRLCFDVWRRQQIVPIYRMPWPVIVQVQPLRQNSVSVPKTQVSECICLSRGDPEQ
jgi:hypothetical protein